MILLSPEEAFELVEDSKTTYEEDLVIVAKAQLKTFIDYIEAKTSDGVFLSDILKEALKEIE